MKDFICKDNNAIIKFQAIENKIDELWIKAEGDKSWVVIGYKDLLDGIKKFKKSTKLN